MPVVQPATEGGGAGWRGAGLVPPGRGTPYRRTAAQPRHLQVGTETLFRTPHLHLRRKVEVRGAEPAWCRRAEALLTVGQLPRLAIFR